MYALPVSLIWFAGLPYLSKCLRTWVCEMLGLALRCVRRPTGCLDARCALIAYVTSCLILAKLLWVQRFGLASRNSWRFGARDVRYLSWCAVLVPHAYELFVVTVAYSSMLDARASVAMRLAPPGLAGTRGAIGSPMLCSPA